MCGHSADWIPGTRWPLDFAFRFRAARPASPWWEAIVRRKGQKRGVIDGLIAVVTGHHYFHVVVETGGGQTLKVFECPDVLADGGREILGLHKAHVLTARKGQDVAESKHAPAAF